jgi:hypothetical protein
MWHRNAIAVLFIEEKLPPPRIMYAQFKQAALRTATEAFATFLREPLLQVTP